MVIPEEKAQILAAAETRSEGNPGPVLLGSGHQGERYNKVVDIWSRANDHVAKAMMDKLGTEEVTTPRARR